MVRGDPQPEPDGTLCVVDHAAVALHPEQRVGQRVVAEHVELELLEVGVERQLALVPGCMEMIAKARLACSPRTEGRPSWANVPSC